jgi:hypothetical protein
MAHVVLGVSLGCVTLTTVTSRAYNSVFSQVFCRRTETFEFCCASFLSIYLAGGTWEYFGSRTLTFGSIGTSLP